MAEARFYLHTICILLDSNSWDVYAAEQVKARELQGADHMKGIQEIMKRCDEGNQ
jgi:hypothetical protein